MIEITCEVCKKVFTVTPLSQADIDNGEELPDVCQDCGSKIGLRMEAKKNDRI